MEREGLTDFILIAAIAKMIKVFDVNGEGAFFCGGVFFWVKLFGVVKGEDKGTRRHGGS